MEALDGWGVKSQLFIRESLFFLLMEDLFRFFWTHFLWAYCYQIAKSNHILVPF